jgi:DegV family protein with EDD domain
MTRTEQAVGVVTDSTAALPRSTLAGAGIQVVPLTVTIAGEAGLEGVQVSPDAVTEALAERRSIVTTSRPSPEQFARTYRQLLAAGARGIVSVHLSGRLSGTCEAAQLAAGHFDGRVSVVDSMTAGSGVGLVALRASEVARAGGDMASVRDAAVTASGAVVTYFYVDTLEYLRRGGRIDAASAFFGTAFSVKPILHVVSGEVVAKEKVRTATRALDRLAELAVEVAGESTVDVAVQHLASPDRARALLDDLGVRLGVRVHNAFLADVGAVIGAHTGPGVIGVTIYHRP